MKIKGLLVDLDGTLYEDGEPIEGVRGALSHLKTSSLVLRYITNTTRKPQSAVYERLTILGFDI